MDADAGLTIDVGVSSSSSPALSPTIDSPITADLKHKKVKNLACNQCEPCKRDECGECLNCKDKAKFGGPNKRKLRCVKRTCAHPKPAVPHRFQVPRTTPALSATVQVEETRAIDNITSTGDGGAASFASSTAPPPTPPRPRPRPPSPTPPLLPSVAPILPHVATSEPALLTPRRALIIAPLPSPCAKTSLGVESSDPDALAMLIAATTTGEGGPAARRKRHTLLPMPSLFDLVAAEPDGDGAALHLTVGWTTRRMGGTTWGKITWRLRPRRFLLCRHAVANCSRVCRRRRRSHRPTRLRLSSPMRLPLSAMSGVLTLLLTPPSQHLPLRSSHVRRVTGQSTCHRPVAPPNAQSSDAAKLSSRGTRAHSRPPMRGAPISLPPSVTSKAAQGLMKSDDTDDDSDDENYRSDPEQVTPLWCGSPPRWLSCIDPSLAAQHLSLREGACIDDLRGAEDSSDLAAFAMLVDACCAAADESVAQDPEKVAVPATDESRGEDEWQHLRSVKAQAAPPLTLPSSTLPSYAAFLAVMDDEKRADEEPNLINATPHESQQRVRLLTIFGWQKVAGSTNHKAHANWYLHLGDPSLEGMRNQKKVIRSIGANMQGDPRYDRAEAQKRAQAALPLLPRARSMQDVHSKSVNTAPVTPPATAGDWRRTSKPSEPSGPREPG